MDKYKSNLKVNFTRRGSEKLCKTQYVFDWRGFALGNFKFHRAEKAPLRFAKI